MTVDNDILYSLVDIIDHITLRYRRTGFFDKLQVVNILKSYSVFGVEEIKSKYVNTDTSVLLEKDISELYDDLILCRTVLLDMSGLK